jgi:predicted permease
MSLFDAFRHRLRPLLRRRNFDREMDEEFRLHLELHAREFPDADSPTARARAHFGSPAYYMEETRRMTPLGWLDALRQDVRYARRNLLRAPAFAAVAVLSLAIGIGANTAIFGLLYSLLFQPLPVSHPEQLVELQYNGRDGQTDRFSFSEYQSLRQSPGFMSLTALGDASGVTIAVGGVRRSVDVYAVDGNFFPTIGLRPVSGRLITAEDEAARAPVVVISEDLWVGLFGRSPAAIGSTITMEAATYTVVGVAPARFRGLGYTGSVQVVVPLSTLPLVGGASVETESATSAMLQIVGRIAHRGDLPAAARMVDASFRMCCAGQRGGAGATGESRIGLASIEHGIPSAKLDVTAMFSRLLFELMGGAAIVLLAACVNIGTLLLARASAREREVAIRLSLGASRRRILGHMLVESAMLATMGSIAGLVLADWALRVIAHHVPPELSPIAGRIGLQFNGELLGFTAAVAVASVLLFGVVPAWRATRTDLIAPLKAGGRSSAARRSGWLDRGVVVAQVAIALTLLNGAGLFVATLRNLRDVNGGFAKVQTVCIELDARGTTYESTGLVPLTERLINRAMLIPGVRSATLSASVPVFGGRRFNRELAVEGYVPSPEESVEVWANAVTPGFFATIGIPLRAGRDFSPNDRMAGPAVAIVNDAFVHQYIRDRDPLGTTVRSVTGPDTTIAQIVGVARDARYIDLRQPPPPMIYLPLAQFAQLPRFGQKLSLTVHTSGDDGATPAPLRKAVLDEVPGVQVGGTATIEAAMDAALSRETFTAGLATLFGAVALILAAIGLYGIVSYRVAQRTREIGVRMALGSAASSVVWMVLRQALVLAAIGVLVGAPLAFAGGKAIAAELFGLAGQNRFFVIGAGVLLLGVAVAAGALPARRAARVDPLIALRAD